MMRIPRILIAGTHSGVGKTTIATGIMAALAGRGLRVQAFKTGPDYIDPGYHTLVTGRPARNLDGYMLSAHTLENLFAKAAAEADIAVIEGVMGLFDGGAGGVGSTAKLAKQLKAPVILVIDIRAMADSAAALAYGFTYFDPEVQIAGIILNRAGSARHFRMVKEAIETKVGIPVIGCLHKDDSLTMPERHLGLLPVEENSGLDLAVLAGKMSAALDLDKLVQIADSAEMLAISSVFPPKRSFPPVRIGVARDEAFAFYYQDSLDSLESLGAELVFFSPLRAKELPAGLDGMILGGGFPEMFAGQLAANTKLAEDIRRVHAAGMPIYAECGGLMFLCRELRDCEGNVHSLTGLIPAVCKMQSRLATVGYVEVEACHDTILGSRGDKIKGHEFHFSIMIPDSDDFKWAFTFRRQRDGNTYPGGYCSGSLLASYLHCHFAGSTAAARYFVNRCREWGQKWRETN